MARGFLEALGACIQSLSDPLDVSRCWDCGYDMRGLGVVPDRCPECGRVRGESGLALRRARFVHQTRQRAWVHITAMLGCVSVMTALVALALPDAGWGVLVPAGIALAGPSAGAMACLRVHRPIRPVVFALLIRSAAWLVVPICLIAVVCTCVGLAIAVIPAMVVGAMAGAFAFELRCTTVADRADCDVDGRTGGVVAITICAAFVAAVAPIVAILTIIAITR